MHLTECFRWCTTKFCRPPPEEVYILHQKLAGAYMLCIKLGAVVRCRDMLEAVLANHKFEDGMPNPISGKYK
jgi:aarF domain-containing kinase